MTAPLILWTYSLAAILFTALALDRQRRGGDRALVAAFALIALWALAVAGLGPRDVAARVTEALRDLALLFAMAALARRVDPQRFGSGRLLAFGAAAVPAAALACFAVLEEAGADAAAMEAGRLAARLLAALGALILLYGLALGAGDRAEARARTLAALALLWGADLFVFAAAHLTGWAPLLALARGVAVIGAGAAFALDAQRRTGRGFTVSRRLSLRVLAAVALVGYTALVVAATGVAAQLGGAHARVAQTAIVTGAAAALLAALSTPWLRAWTRVVVEKNLFAHRYDYRIAWQRFTGTLGRPGEDGPLPLRVVQATADLIDAPAGLLLVKAGEGLEPAARWNWNGAGAPGNERLAAHLSGTGRIVELDRVRDGSAPPEDGDAVPAWLRDDADAWVVVPLIHQVSLVGAILLARPPLARALDWEDFDLLRIAGQQAASYLAEDRAHAELADARRFDEFNRRFAFILHDIKNLVSQISLVARNAERHADNPEFRADMIATLRDSAERMTALVERLSHRPARGLQPQAIDVRRLLEAAAHARRTQHPVLVQAQAALFARADDAALAQVLGHLLQNAVEASPAGAPVTLSACLSDDRVLIEVADRGGGMAPGFVRDQLFRPFSSSKPGGFGLGAFEARELVRAMGGAIEVESREGEGTRFTVALPAAAPAETTMDRAA